IYHQDVLDFARTFELSQDGARLAPEASAPDPDMRPGPTVVKGLQVVSAFVTRYLPGHKEIDDHVDLCDLTLIVDLSDADYGGGGVAGSEDSPWSQVRLHSGERGCAVAIGKEVLHKAITLRSGVRWIMVIFAVMLQMHESGPIANRV